ncbi:MAG: hypothetical protein ACOCXI_15245, partial [Chloroflexota bacterium]
AEIRKTVGLMALKSVILALVLLVLSFVFFGWQGAVVALFTLWTLQEFTRYAIAAGYVAEVEAETGEKIL